MTTLPSAAQAEISVATFLAKADALRAKGPLALFSSDIGLLKREGEAAVDAWRAQVRLDDGRRNACPPPKEKISDDRFLGMLTAVPPPERARTSVATAVTRGLNRLYPCPAGPAPGN